MMEKQDKVMEKLNLYVIGMTCATCARTVEKAISKLPGVKLATVNLATNSAFIILEKPLEFEEIKKAVERVGYGISTEQPEEEERRRHKRVKRNFLLSISFTLPLVILMVLHMLKFHIPYFPWIEIAIGAVVLFVAGFDTFKGAFIAVKHLHSNMDTLISLGAISSWLTAVLHVSGLPVDSFGSIGAMIVAIHLTGRFIESNLRDRAMREIKGLLSLRPREARVIVEGKEEFIPASAVTPGMVVLVKPGERVPADGTIIEGQTNIDESVITGEPMPLEKGVGGIVIGGALNLNGAIKVRIDRPLESSFLSRMMELLKQVQGTRIPIQKIADRITNYFVPTILALATISFVFWYVSFYSLESFLSSLKHIFPWVLLTENRFSFALTCFISTIVIACPCALGLAIPMALLRGTTVASNKGILIKNAEIIQTALTVKYALFDKTGTLTEGKPKVTYYQLPEGELEKVVALERNSAHPLAGAIAGLQDKEDEFVVKDFKEVAGFGVTGEIGNSVYFVGKPEDLKPYEDYISQGKTVVEVRKGNKIIGFFIIEDKIREDTEDAIGSLMEFGVVPVLITGDNRKSAEIVGGKLGFKHIYAELAPEDKVHIIHKFQGEGAKVLMTGDGINDAAALKAADVSISISGGTDLAIENADAVIVKGGLSRIVDFFGVSKSTFRKVKENLVWAFLYNVLAIPLAMIGLINPIFAEVAMALSSITVIVNSLRLK